MEIKINHSSFYSSSYSNLIFSCAQAHNRVFKVVADRDQYFYYRDSPVSLVSIGAVSSLVQFVKGLFKRIVSCWLKLF